MTGKTSARTWVVSAVSAVALAASAPWGTTPVAAAGGEASTAVVELGRRLFFDPAVSRSGDNSCASCHEPDHAWSSPRRREFDDFTLTPRHSQTLVDAGLSGSAHWDGEFATIEDLVVARLGVPSGERGNPFRFVGSPAAAPSAAPASTAGGGSYGGGSSAAPPPPPPAPSTQPAATEPDAPGGAADTGDDPKASDDPAKPDVPGDDHDRSRTGRDRKREAARDAHAGLGTGEAAPKERLPATVVEFKDDEGVTHRVDLARLVPVAQRLEDDGRYAEAFQRAFGSTRVTTARLGEAIAAFVRTIRSSESPYDRFAAGDADAISVSAQRGLAVFRGKGRCSECHRLGGGHARLTDDAFHVTGIVARTFGGPAGLETVHTAVEKAAVDRGRARFTEARSEERAFKTPTLRDVALRGPYMHDGSLATLEDVVRYYSRGAVPDPALDRAIRGFEVSDAEVRDLVEFLRTLTSDRPAGIAPDLAGRAETTKVRILDAKRHPIAGLRVRVVPDGDRLPGDVPLASPERELETDAKGIVEFVPPRRTHARLELPPALRAPLGEWIPDTCGRLDVVLPVTGRASLLLTVVRPEEALERFSATVPPLGEEAMRRGSASIPVSVAVALRARRVVFEREGGVPVGGANIVRYMAWIPAGAPDEGLLTVPCGTGRVTKPVDLRPGRETRIDLRDLERALVR